MCKILYKFDDNGFSLVTIAIAMLVVGLVMVPVLNQYTKSLEINDKRAQNNAAIEIQETLTNFALTKGYLPAPANPTLAITNANYGIPITTLPSFAAGECADGSAAVNGVLCRRGERNIAGGGTNGDHEFDHVYIGSLPSSILGISPEDSLDRYLNQYTYIVAAAMVDPVDFDNTRGNIRARSNQTGANAFGTDRDIQFAVISHGMNGVGAYNSNGLRPVVCPAADTTGIAFDSGSNSLVNGSMDAVAVESLNCDDDAEIIVMTDSHETTAVPNNSIHQEYGTIDVPGSNYFDDRVKFSQTIFNHKWSPTGDDLTVMTSGGETSRLAIGHSDNYNPSNSQIDVNGSVRAGDGITTVRLCNDNQSSCVLVDDIVSDDVNSTTFLKCNTRGLKDIIHSNGTTGRWSKAEGVCEVRTRLADGSNIGSQDSTGIICANGSKGLNAAGELICK